VIIDRGYRGLISPEMMNHFSMPKELAFKNEDGIEHILLNFLNCCTDKAYPDIERFVAHLIKLIEPGVEINLKGLCLSHIQHINDDTCERLRDNIASLLACSEGFASEQRLSVTDILTINEPIIVVTHNNSSTGNAILSAIKAHISQVHTAIMQREQRPPLAESDPKLLVLRYHDEVTMPGFAASCSCSNSANWTIAMSYNMNDFHNLLFVTTETPTIVANVHNIIKIKKKGVLEWFNGRTCARFYTLRNWHTDLRRAFSDMGCYQSHPDKEPFYVSSIDVYWQ
jgi:hypothetical protein